MNTKIVIRRKPTLKESIFTGMVPVVERLIKIRDKLSNSIFFLFQSVLHIILGFFLIFLISMDILLLPIKIILVYKTHLIEQEVEIPDERKGGA